MRHASTRFQRPCALYGYLNGDVFRGDDFALFSGDSHGRASDSDGYFCGGSISGGSRVDDLSRAYSSAFDFRGDSDAACACEAMSLAATYGDSSAPGSYSGDFARGGASSAIFSSRFYGSTRDFRDLALALGLGRDGHNGADPRFQRPRHGQAGPMAATHGDGGIFRGVSGGEFCGSCDFCDGRTAFCGFSAVSLAATRVIVACGTTGVHGDIYGSGLYFRVNLFRGSSAGTVAASRHSYSDSINPDSGEAAGQTATLAAT